MDAPAHTQLAPTKDLRSLAHDVERKVTATNKWKNGSWAGPGRDENDEKHRTPAGPHPIHLRRQDRGPHSRRKSALDVDLDEELKLARENILPASPRSPKKIAPVATGDDLDDYYSEDYPEEDNELDGEVPQHPGAKDAYNGVIDKEVERIADGEYDLIGEDLEVRPTDPAALKKYLARKKRADQAEAKDYVVVESEGK